MAVWAVCLQLPLIPTQLIPRSTAQPRHSPRPPSVTTAHPSQPRHSPRPPSVTTAHPPQPRHSLRPHWSRPPIRHGSPGTPNFPSLRHPPRARGFLRLPPQSMTPSRQKPAFPVYCTPTAPGNGPQQAGQRPASHARASSAVPVAFNENGRKRQKHAHLHGTQFA
jgi:hypothetical protein